jgi:RNA polymerase sigma-70 factor (ECF subfamily)
MTVNVTPSDEELIISAKQGSLESFTLLYERYLPLVYNRVRFTVPQQDVDDVTQEVFIAVLRSLHSFRGDSRFGAWLRTVATRQIASYYRRFPQLSLETNLDENLPSTARNAAML